MVRVLRGEVRLRAKPSKLLFRAGPWQHRCAASCCRMCWGYCSPRSRHTQCRAALKAATALRVVTSGPHRTACMAGAASTAAQLLRLLLVAPSATPSAAWFRCVAGVVVEGMAADSTAPSTPGSPCTTLSIIFFFYHYSLAHAAPPPLFLPMFRRTRGALELVRTLSARTAVATFSSTAAPAVALGSVQRAGSCPARSIPSSAPLYTRAWLFSMRAQAVGSSNHRRCSASSDVASAEGIHFSHGDAGGFVGRLGVAGWECRVTSAGALPLSLVRAAAWGRRACEGIDNA